MKFLFLSLVLILSSVGRAEVASTVSASPLFEDILLSDPSSKNLQSSDSDESSEPHKTSESDTLKFKEAVVNLATNKFRTPEGKALTQAEANLLVKYFVQLNIKPEIILDSYKFQSDLKKEIHPNVDSIQADADRAQVIQTITNIAKTRVDMAAYLEHPNVRCFFRNYRDENALSDVNKLTDNAKLKAPLTEIYKRSDDVLIVGKCQGCGLLALEEFAMTPEQTGKYSACGGK